MEKPQETRGPIEKGSKGWPINPFGVAALTIITIAAAFLIGKPLLNRSSIEIANSGNVSRGGQIISPQSGEIVRSNNLKIELSIDNPNNVEKIQFWANTYIDNNWEIIGESSAAPYQLDWQIPQNYQNKAIAITSHIFTKDGNIIKDPGGWRKGIIILEP